VIILGGLKLEIFRRVTPSSEGEIESNMNWGKIQMMKSREAPWSIYEMRICH
jgi:hypothetical protein